MIKNKIKKIIRYVLLIAGLLGAFLVLTAGINIGTDIKFKNVNKPFIDLDAMVQDIKPGQGGNEETGIDDIGEVEIDAEEKTVEVVEVVIEIREKEIKINGIVVVQENFEKVFDAIHKDGMKVTLVDDYAEYYTYTDIKKCLEEKKIKVTEKVN